MINMKVRISKKGNSEELKMRLNQVLQNPKTIKSMSIEQNKQHAMLKVVGINGDIRITSLEKKEKGRIYFSKEDREIMSSGNFTSTIKKDKKDYLISIVPNKEDSKNVLPMKKLQNNNKSSNSKNTKVNVNAGNGIKRQNICSVDLGTKTLIAAVTNTGAEFIRSFENSFLEIDKIRELSDKYREKCEKGRTADFSSFPIKAKEIIQANEELKALINKELKYLILSFIDFLTYNGVSSVFIGEILGKNDEKEMDYSGFLNKDNSLSALSMRIMMNELKKELLIKNMDVAIIDEKSTSLICPFCKTKTSYEKVDSIHVRCTNCSEEGHKDIFAAMNILKRAN